MKKFYECISKVTTVGHKGTYEEAEKMFLQIFRSWSKVKDGE